MNSKNRVIINELVWLCALILLLLPISPGLAESEQREVVVYLNQKQNKQKDTLNNVKVLDDRNKDNGIYLVSESELSKLKTKKEKGEITAFSYNEKYQVTLAPSDPEYNNQWALPKINAPTAWEVTTGSSSLTVAVIDTGFQLNHEDLQGRFVAGHDFLPGSADATDPSLSPFVETCEPPFVNGAYNHATMVSGVIAASSNAVGITGIDWQVKIMPLQVMDNCGSGDTDSIAAAIDWAVTNGADIINMSLGGSLGSPVLQAAINEAYNAGVTLVAASGNAGGSSVYYPAAYSNVIAVGSVGNTDALSSFSNYGPELDVVAPGESIRTTNTIWTGGSYSATSYAYASGTSLSTPYVSGLASLIASTGSYSPAVIKSKIIDGANKVAGMGGQNFTNYYGYGRIDSAASVTVDVPPAPAPVYAPVYRFYNMKNGAHFYTANEAEKNNVIARYASIYKFEGVVYQINISNKANNRPLYRLWNTTGSHFYTVSYEEAINATVRWPAKFKLEGPVYNVSLDSGDAPIYRFYNIKNGTHFYTANVDEKNNVIARWSGTYKYEGIVYYLGQ